MLNRAKPHKAYHNHCPLYLHYLLPKQIILFASFNVFFIFSSQDFRIFTLTKNCFWMIKKSMLLNLSHYASSGWHHYLFNLQEIHLSGSPFLRRITLPILDLDLDFSFVAWDCSLSSSIIRSWNSKSLIFSFTLTPVYLCGRDWYFKTSSSIRLFKGFFNLEWAGYSLTLFAL